MSKASFKELSQQCLQCDKILLQTFQGIIF